MNVIFRADANPVIGAGHVMRCLALAKQLRVLGWQCLFAGHAQTQHLRVLKDSGYEFIILNDISGDYSGDSTDLKRAVPGGCDLLVIDHYGWSVKEEESCRDWAGRILVIDDLAAQAHDCDVLVDQTLGRVYSDYQRLLSQECKTLFGSEYALLRDEFLTHRTRALTRRNQQLSDPRRILISLGAMDNDNVTTIVLQAISNLMPDVSVDVVLGEQAPHLESIKTLVGEVPFQNATLCVGVDDMARLMEDADVAIGAAGSSAWERCCLGLPVVMINVADNQTAVAAALEGQGAATALGKFEDLEPQAIHDAVEDLLSNQDHYMAMSRSAAEVCDGRGCLRVVAALAGEQRVADGRRITLRVATHADAEQMLTWQQDPVIRQYSRNPGIPSANEHGQWFDQKLSDPDCLFFVLDLSGTPSGVLRLDWRNDRKGWEVSILVASTHQRLGIGAAALELGRRLVVEGDLWAFIMASNIGSQRLFESENYRSVGGGWYLNTLNSAGSESCLQ